MSIKLYLPESVVNLLHYNLSKYPPRVNTNFSINSQSPLFEYDIGKFYYLLDVLINPQNRCLKYRDLNGFSLVTLCSQYLKRCLGRDYKTYVTYLIFKGFINTNNSYNIGKCLEYHLWNNIYNNDIIHFSDKRFNKIDSTLYYSGVKQEQTSAKTYVKQGTSVFLKNENKYAVQEVHIDKKSKITKEIIKEYELELGRNRKYPSYLKKMSIHFRKSLKINFDDALEYCKKYMDKKALELEQKFKNGTISKNQFLKELNSIPKKHAQRITSVYNLHYGKKNKSLKFNRNKTNKRVDTNLTSMAKDIRTFIVGRKNMSYLDLSNSQPVLFNILLKKYYKNGNANLKSEIEKYYISTITGNWYEELCTVFKLKVINDENREIAKKNWMKIAYSKNESYKVLKKKFNKAYPEINKLIAKIKSKHYSEFAIKLQRIESEIFIDEICKCLVEKNIMPYSIHDGVLVPNDHEEETYEIMAKILKKFLGSVPVISIDEVKKYDKLNTAKLLNNQFKTHFDS